jgi:hypothetical protein
MCEIHAFGSASVRRSLPAKRILGCGVGVPRGRRLLFQMAREGAE